MEKFLPPIPSKRYFTIGEVGDLCGVKPHVLRYWEQEFTQLRPVKRRGNRRYYQHHEVLMIRRIRDLLYDQGFTINGARNKMQESFQTEKAQTPTYPDVLESVKVKDVFVTEFSSIGDGKNSVVSVGCDHWGLIRQELCEIRHLLSGCD